MNLAQDIRQQLPFEPTRGQAELIRSLEQFLISRDPDRCMILRGYAGTGKTSVIGALVRMLSGAGIPCVLLAPTGRAAKVMNHYSSLPAYTIHHGIYRIDPKTERFVRMPNTLKRGIILVDEASMISYDVLDDLKRWVYSAPHCYLILVGDDAQLPPVGQEFSPALQADIMAGYGLNIWQNELSEIVRQAAESTILHNATRVRQGLEPDRFADDFVRITPAEAGEAIERSYNDVGLGETLIITRSNFRTNIYNNTIRANILWMEDRLDTGDRIMVSRNNYSEDEFLANGEMLEIKRLRHEHEMYGFQFVEAELIGIDQEFEINRLIWLDTLNTDNPEQNRDLQSTLFDRIAEDYADIRNQKERLEKIRKDPYYNALQVRYAYAVTCHKAQGGQWKHVFIDVPLESDERWMYTAITRATERIYWIESPKKETE